MKLICKLIFIMELVAGVFSAPPIGAQGFLRQASPQPTAAETKALSPAEEIRAKREKLSEEIASIRKALETTAETDAGAVQSLQRVLAILQETDLSYEQRLAALESNAEFERLRGEMEAELLRFRETGPQEKKPYSFLLLDRLRDESNAEERRADLLDASVKAAEYNLQLARDAFVKEERERRQAKEVAEGAQREKSAETSSALRIEEIESRLAGELVDLQQAKLENEKAMRDIQGMRRALMKEKVALIARETTFTPEDMKTKIADIDKNEAAFKRKLEETKLAIEKSEAVQKWNLGDAKIGLPRMDALGITARRRAEGAPAEDQAAVEELETTRLGRWARSRELSFLMEQIKRCAYRRKLWERRYQINARLIGKNDMAVWRKETRQDLENHTREAALTSSKLGEIRKAVIALSAKIDDAEATPDVAKWIKSQREQMIHLIGLYEQELDGIERIRMQEEKLLAEIGTQVQTLSLGERVAFLWSKVVELWNFEITSVDDRPITISKIVRGILLLIFGIWLSRVISRLLGRRFLKRLRVNESAAAAFQSLMFYILVLVFTLFALHLINVPLTVFTILGGALAIGVGFGSQSILNNFISGLILLAERPVRVGDLIQIGDLVGTVETIGARSTRIHTASNIDIIVPNSTFLQENVINWTHTNTTVRTSVTVGVRYGSSTEEVTRLLRKAVEEHSRVLKYPVPVVLFAAFGESSLNFEVLFWIRMSKQIQRQIVESEVRYRIDALFKEAGIVIAFPQRDLHLGFEKAIEVKVLSGAKKNQSAGE